jgi:tRNA (cytosine38-C5)-methyltransferase
MSAADLDAYVADLWLMAPPCQPFTRQGKQLGGADARSSSFLHLLQQLQLMQAQPAGLLIENVVGFQGSDVHTQLAAALMGCGYHMQVGWAYQ